MQRIVDLHMHVVPGIDDGARSIEESLQMLMLVAEQGVTDVFCTSHNGYSKEDGGRYRRMFSRLEHAARKAGIKIHLYKGREIFCTEDGMDDTIYGLGTGAFSTLVDTNCVLTELYPDATPSEALAIVKALTEHGYCPIIAHMERNDRLPLPTVKRLIQNGALIQVNAFSFADEKDARIQARARELLRHKSIHFIGSDAHRMDHRSPRIENGVHYILAHVERSYSAELFSGNAQRFLSIHPS